MNCAEFQRVLPEIGEGPHNAEQKAHLRSCATCSDLVSDLNAIAEQARQLRACDEPSPRVWNSLEIALRQEGLIHPLQRGPALVPALPRRWTMAWLMPVAALLVVGAVVLWSPNQPIWERLGNTPPAVSNSQGNVQLAANDDQQLLAAVESRSPDVQAQYAANLANVNSYIQDAEASAQADPNDEEAQQILMNAYEQKAVVYQMALDHSLP
jgi:hypothetical protein